MMAVNDILADWEQKKQNAGNPPAVPVESEPQVAPSNPIVADFKRAQAEGEEKRRLENRPWWERARDTVTGSDRMTPEMESLEPMENSPEFNSLSGASFRTSFGSLYTGDDERKMRIIKENYPEATFSQDSKGNWIANMPSNEDYSVNAPGIGPNDLATAGAQVGTFILLSRLSPLLFPALNRHIAKLGAKAKLTKGSTVTEGAVAGASSGLIEGGIAGTGGGFDLGNVALDTALGSAGAKVSQWISGLNSGNSQTVGATENEIRRQLAQNNPNLNAKEADDLSDQIIDAIKKGDQERLAALSKPDASYVEAGKTLGLNEPGLASHASTSPKFIAEEQILKSVPGSPLREVEDRAISELSHKADELIERFGGTTQQATLNQELITNAKSTIQDLGKKADDAYDKLGEAIPPTSPVDVSPLREVISEEITKLGGERGQLSPLERRINAVINPSSGNDVTYYSIDKIRKEVGAAIGSKQGRYKDATSYELSKYYDLLTQAQESAAPALSGEWKAAKELVSKRKKLEENAVIAFGQELTNDFIPALGKSMRAMSQNKVKDFDKLLGALDPKDRKQAVTSALNDVFTMRSGKEKQLSIAGFDDWFKGISRDPALKNRIYKNIDPEMRTMLNALGKRADGMRKAMANEIKTGRLSEAQSMQKQRMENAFKLIAKVGFATLGDIVVMGVNKVRKDPKAKALKILTDPQFANDIVKLARSGNEKLEKKIMRNQKFKDFVEAFPEESGPMIRVGLRNWLEGKYQEYSE
ncbi:hypothetical protein [Vibrio sp. SCSIO 43136]|uniref:hypothetical protein n=1 Tax=Vibrio sp. SCSIO 43136 TaxID=2819101 RepID=UPI0020750E62|nr:hypothetical protein [Vibrio sp. SCSIO 43136]USD64206.1 hypothetical protein J4N39_08790 [Vibrio sp. SCSIO 43136]